MSINRRSFVRSVSVAAGALAVPDTLRALPSPAGAVDAGNVIASGASAGFAPHANAAALENGQRVQHHGSTLRDDNLWRTVRASYALPADIVNLDSGAVNPAPVVVQAAEARYAATAHTAPTHFLNRLQWPEREGVRASLASAFGCDVSEMALTRGTTESMEAVLMGLDLKAGDEVLTTTHDYWRFLNSVRQRTAREGVVLRQITLPVPLEDADVLVARFLDAVTPRTRAILVSHVVNLTGQVLPLRPLIEAARARNILVLVDGAHGFAHIPFTRDALDCDVYGTSLHKWLGAPHGTGFLYVRKTLIPEIWPLFPAPDTLRDDITKFENIGTTAAAPHLAIADALAFFHGIGAERKHARLLELRLRLVDALADAPGITVHTSRRAEYSGAILLVDVTAVAPGALAAWLWSTHGTLVRPITHPEFRGIRITPNTFTSYEEIDAFAERLSAVAKRGALT